MTVIAKTEDIGLAPTEDEYKSEQDRRWGELAHGEEEPFNLAGSAITDTDNGGFFALVRRPLAGDWSERKNH